MIAVYVSTLRENLIICIIIHSPIGFQFNGSTAGYAGKRQNERHKQTVSIPECLYLSECESGLFLNRFENSILHVM